MNKNNISDLRAVMFQTMQDLRDGKIDIDKAKAVSEMSQTIINSAKVEVDYIKATGGVLQSDFMPNNSTTVQTPTGTPLPNGIAGITRHVLKG